jgi:16S rRNA (uracil1498-N3)-methyltransferase
MSSFYAPELSAQDSVYHLSEEESKHCVKVLRMQEGAAIELVNGNGLQAQCVLETAHAKRSMLRVVAQVHHEPTPAIHIALAPTKNLDRIEWYLEKATELGISKLSFLLCARSERKQLNLERLEKIAIAAMKQSKRYYLPQIEPLQPFEAFLDKHPKGYFGHCEGGPKIGLAALLPNLPFLIGPEGDFSSKEIQLALQAGYQAVDMSAFRLRTETAALLATTALLAK